MCVRMLSIFFCLSISLQVASEIKNWKVENLSVCECVFVCLMCWMLFHKPKLIILPQNFKLVFAFIASLSGPSYKIPWNFLLISSELWNKEKLVWMNRKAFDALDDIFVVRALLSFSRSFRHLSVKTKFFLFAFYLLMF